MQPRPHVIPHVHRCEYRQQEEADPKAVHPPEQALGEEYSHDRCSFAEVNVCSGYLHQMLRDLYSRLDHASEVPGYHHRILLLPAPGEQHILGLSILGESFRRRGWDVSGGPAQDRTELLKLIAREHFDAIGFSIGSDRWLSPLADELHRLRRNAQNRNILVMVGDQVIDDQPTLTGALDADLTVRDARLAPDSALTALEDAARAGYVINWSFELRYRTWPRTNTWSF
jgi:methylmalonyl-CoA mutase cobalamin-binding subunit